MEKFLNKYQTVCYLFFPYKHRLFSLSNLTILTKLSLNLQESRTPRSNLLFLFKWFVKKLMKVCLEMMIPTFKHFKRVHPTIYFTITRRRGRRDIVSSSTPFCLWKVVRPFLLYILHYFQPQFQACTSLATMFTVYRRTKSAGFLDLRIHSLPLKTEKCALQFGQIIFEQVRTASH